MSNPAIDIIVTVWNRPVETRNCLVNLMDHSPDARFILVDNGSDRETERLLQEFAEILDQRALLLRNDTNRGYIRAVNRGLARAEAPYVAIIRNSAIVSAGWLPSLLKLAGERSDAGIIIPRLVPTNGGKAQPAGHSSFPPIEADHGSLTAMFLKKRLYDLIGGFDEEMDGGIWCLRDFSRRACRAGFFTYRVESAPVSFTEEVPLGSMERREQALKRSIAMYRERWGAESSFLLHLPKGTDLNVLRQKLVPLLQGARQGHEFSILTHPRLHKELTAAGCHNLHERIRFVRLPLMFESRTIRGLLATAGKAAPPIQAVSGIDDMEFPGADASIPFSRLERIIAAAQAEKYGI
ncbi:MAG TPA: glycosyltransferase [Geobacteraceae bacterium]